MMGMFKRASETDVDDVVAFERAVMDKKLYGRPLNREAALREICVNEYYVARAEGRVIVTGAFRRRADTSAYLSNIAVNPEMRRRGLARAMMKHLLGLYPDAPSIDLAVHPDNHPARALYTSFRFVPISRHENFFGDGEPRLIMERTGGTDPRTVVSRS